CVRSDTPPCVSACRLVLGPQESPAMVQGNTGGCNPASKAAPGKSAACQAPRGCAELTREGGDAQPEVFDRLDDVDELLQVDRLGDVGRYASSSGGLTGTSAAAW